MSKIVIDLLNLPVSGELHVRLYAADSRTRQVISSSDLECRFICIPGDIVSLEPYFVFERSGLK